MQWNNLAPNTNWGKQIYLSTVGKGSMESESLIWCATNANANQNWSNSKVHFIGGIWNHWYGTHGNFMPLLSLSIVDWARVANHLNGWFQMFQKWGNLDWLIFTFYYIIMILQSMHTYIDISNTIYYNIIIILESIHTYIYISNVTKHNFLWRFQCWKPYKNSK